MAKEKQKSEGPICACGRTDLYEVWLKLQENPKEEVAESATSNKVEVSTSSAIDSRMDKSH